jgi:serine/threonine-protein kinase
MQGRVLNGRYELIEKIGEGGMALTWKGRDLLLGREVAVKVMRESLAADPQFIARFRQEAQAAANLSHEHIAAIYDFGSDDGIHYIVMEYVPGEDLKQHLKRRGPLALPEALELAIQIAEALEAAHAKGIVHRDIKPANILLTEEGLVKVADFGIARVFSAPDDNSTGTLIGSVHYLSPEQARGEAVGPQADIYSLGTVIFEILTGRPPFQASNPVAVVHKHIYDPPPSPRSLRTDLPLEVENILLCCLSKDLSNRYATARELLNYLRTLQSKLPSMAGEKAEKSAAAQARIIGKKAKKHRLAAALAAAGVMVLGGLGFFFFGSYPGDADEQIEVPRLVALDIFSARRVAEEMGLRLRVAGSVYSPTIAKDQIISQLPLPEAKVQRGTLIEVKISLGQEALRVPEVKNMTETQARQALDQALLKVKDVKEAFDPTIPAGLVISSDPSSGAAAPEDGSVVLIISKGPENPTVTPITPVTPPKQGKIYYTLPEKAGSSDASEVIVEASDAHGLKVLYRAQHAPGESIPPQEIPSTRPITIRIKLDNRVVREVTVDH